MDELTNRVKNEVGTLRREAKEKSLTYIAGGFGLVAGLAWNDAIRSLIDVLFPFSKDSLWAKFGYAIIVTLAVVMALVYLNRLFQKQD